MDFMVCVVNLPLVTDEVAGQKRREVATYLMDRLHHNRSQRASGMTRRSIRHLHRKLDQF